jgi:CHAD domain-containing protein
MKEQKYDAIQCYAAGYMLPVTQDLLRSLEGIQTRSEIEDVHDLRVASRRIRTALVIFGDHLPRKKVRNWMDTVRIITRTYGTTRDMDVQIVFLENLMRDTHDRRVRAGLHRIHLRLLQKRSKREKIVVKHTDAFLNDKNILDLLATTQQIKTEGGGQLLPQPLYELAFHTLQLSLDQFLSYEIFIHQVEKIHELHLMRIAAKRLRYTMEVFSALYAGKIDPYLAIMKDVQQQLGEIRDCDVWMEYIPVFLEKERKRTQQYYGRKDAIRRLMPGIEYLEQNRRQERDRLYRGFLKNWQSWRTQDIWLHLRELILQTTLSQESGNTVEPQTAAQG